MQAAATVRVTVTPVNDAPVAVDDAAETPEDKPTVVHVLANDTDVDGDPLQVVEVTIPAHGTSIVEGAGVRYAPAPNYHGPDTFSYTIADPDGSKDTALVTLTVLPVNDAPEAVGAIPDQVLEEGGDPVTLDLAPYFTDVDGDGLTYTAESSDPAAAGVAVSGSTLTLSAVVRGAATVTATAADPEGETAEQIFGVSVGDRLVREVLTDTLAALGRGHLSSVRQTVGRRLETAGADTRVVVAGQSVGPEALDRFGSGNLARTQSLLFRASLLQQRSARWRRHGRELPRTRRWEGTAAPAASAVSSGSVPTGVRRCRAPTCSWSFGDRKRRSGEPAGGGRRWTVWGQGDLQTFSGIPEAGEGLRRGPAHGLSGVRCAVEPGIGCWVWRWRRAAARGRGRGALPPERFRPR